MEDQIKPELLALGMEINAELKSIGMDDIEIMNFWQECLDVAKKNKVTTTHFKDYEQN